jgi:hypothetical protein
MGDLCEEIGHGEWIERDRVERLRKGNCRCTGGDTVRSGEVTRAIERQARTES